MRVAAAALAIALAAGGAAHANGRAPLTNGVHFGPTDTHSIYIASTFGLLVSHDDGCTFDWVCEDAMGYAGTFDPKYAIGSDGAIFATTFTGLHVSRDGGCSFQDVGSDLGSDDPTNFSRIWVDALDIGPTGEVWVGTAENGVINDVLASSDGGRTFASRGLPSSQIWYKSAKVAPSDPRRIYVTGYQVAGTLADGGAMAPTAHLLRSDDDGGTWAPASLANVAMGTTPIVLVPAVDPTDEDKVFLTSLGGGTSGGDGLYLSTDGGATFQQVLLTADTIRDVVIRDQTHVLVATLMDGTYASEDGGQTFAKMPGTPELACLGQRSDGLLFGCGANWQPDYEAVASSASGSAWSEVFRFVNLAGPLACPAGTGEHDQCAAEWPMLQQQFGATGPTCGAQAGDGSGRGSAGTDAPMPSKKPGGGCCDAGDDTTAWGCAMLVLVVAGAVLRGRRRLRGRARGRVA